MATPQSNLPIISGDDCGTCRRAIVEAFSVAKAQPPGYGDWIELCPSFAHLEAAAATCNLCRLIRQEIVYNLASLEYLKDCIYPVQVCWQLSDADYSRSTLRFRVVLTHRGWCEASLVASHQPEAAGEIIPNFKDEAQFDAVIKTVHWWLRTCKDGHESCQLPAPQNAAAQDDFCPPLPTHVIDVRPPRRSNQDHTLEEPVPSIRLVEGENRRGEYVTLSYCWGTSGKNFKTTSSNLAQQLSEIPWDRLPQTIQDAVVVTRKLGIRYLWVDALCVVQARYSGDVTSDWPVEATRMGQYYENATCTLAASSSHDCADGMLADRPALRFGPTRDVTIDFDDVFLGKQAKIQIVGLRGPPIEAAMEESHLLSRGWCVQERALSRRMLYFARDALFWECNELRAGEHSPSKNLGFVPRAKTHAVLHTQSWRSVVGQWDLLGAGLRNLVRKHYDAAEGLSVSDVELILGPAWMGLIERYSACAFTNYSDRLVALSSVTEKLSRMTGAGNVAGHWRETLGRSLSWTALSPTRTREASKDRGFPTWAWPAADLGVSFEGLDGTWHESMTVEDIKRDPAKADNVHAGHVLRIRGTFCEMPLAQWGLREYRKSSAATYTTSSFVESVAWDHLPTTFDENRLMACLFIGSVRQSEHVSDTVGLVVQRTGRFDGDGGQVEEFERVGLLRFENLAMEGLPGAVRRTIDIA